jgi:surfactin synthase thioesterase subunit
MLSLPLNLEVSNLPVVYIQAAGDKLVSATKANEFSRYFNNIAFKVIEGPHFILQARPLECSVIISELALSL